MKASVDVYYKTLALVFIFISDVVSASVKVEPLKQEGAPLVSMVQQSNQYWSPSLACGLSTPPPGGLSHSMGLDASFSGSHGHLAPGQDIFYARIH